MLSRMSLVYKTLASAFNQRITPVFTGLGILVLHGIVSLGLALDNLFFPSLRKKQIVAPIVIVGNPRSGTTFLQRFLVDNGFGAGMRIWKMLYPSLTIQTLVRPFLPLMEKVSPARFHNKAAHDTTLTGVETDDPALLFRFFDGFFLYGFFLAWAEEELKGLFEPENRDTSERDFKWLETMWRRNLVGEKSDRVAAKIFSLSMRIPRFLEFFPDAKILYLLRDPLETVPSGLSLVTGVLDKRFGFWSLPEDKRRRFIERLYGAFLELNLRFHADYVNGKIPEKNLKLVHYTRIMGDFETLMDEIMGFVEFKPTAEFKKLISETAAKQKAYVSKHKYDLAKFGLDEERIKKDYAVIYKDLM